MARLVPSRVTDRNGRSTTVYRRVDEPSAAGSGKLAQSRPSIAGAPAETTVKRAQLSSGFPGPRSIICAENSRHPLLRNLFDSRGQLDWQPQDTVIPDAGLFEYMRSGFDLTEAAMLHSVGVTAEQVRSDPVLKQYLPGSMGLHEGKEGRFVLHRGQVIDDLQHRGVPAGEAYSLLLNGLQDGHLYGVLGLDELIELFSQFPYFGAQQAQPGQISSKVIDALVAGRLPFELVRTNSRAELGRVVRESEGENGEGISRWMDEDRAVFVRVVAYTLKHLPKREREPDTPATTGMQLWERFGERIFEVESLQLLRAGDYVAEDGARVPLGVDEALFCEAVAAGAGKGWRTLWGTGSPDAQRLLRPRDILQLRDAGATAEQAKELLIERELPPRTALAVVRGIEVGLADGML